jgi:hypothetical protein
MRLPKGRLIPRKQVGSRYLDNFAPRRDITFPRLFPRRRPSDTWQPGELAPVSSQRPPGRLWYTAHTPCIPIRRQLVSPQVSSEVAPLRYIVPWQHRSTIARCAYQRDSEYSAEYVLHFGDAFTVGMERKRHRRIHLKLPHKVFAMRQHGLGRHFKLVCNVLGVTALRNQL